MLLYSASHTHCRLWGKIRCLSLCLTEKKQRTLDYIWSVASILPIIPAFYCRAFIHNFRYELLFSNYDSNYLFIFWVSSLELCCSVTTLSSSSVHPLSQPVFSRMLIFTDWTEACLSAVFNWFFYICRYILSLTAFPVLWEIFKDFTKIIEAITTNTKVNFNTTGKCKSLLQGLKAFSFFQENYMA